MALKLHSEKGSMILGLVLFTLTMLGLVAWYLSSDTTWMVKSQKLIVQSDTIALIQGNIRDTIANDYAWNLMANDSANNTSANLNCVLPSAAACVPVPTNTAPYDLTIYEFGLSGKVPLSGTNRGFSPSANPCSTFNLVGTGDDACPYAYQMTWAPICPAPPTACLNPPIKIAATFQYNAKNTSGPVNPRNYDFVIIR